MGTEPVISLQGVSKCFKRYHRPVDRLKEVLIPGKSRAEEFWALRDITLEVRRGETLGIVGQNGSGKSTMLQIIAGTLQPTIGQVSVKGRVSALLELGSGFNPEFTGRQNVLFNGRILGLAQAEIEAKFDQIARFADIGDFIEQPVKTYSSGMFVRLAFAVAIHVDPDILIVDEALSVGDGIFVHRCMSKIKDFQDAGGTILFVSHDMGSITRLCSEAVWINGGQGIDIGQPEKITKQYQAWIYDNINAYRKKESASLAIADSLEPADHPEQTTPQTKANPPDLPSRDRAHPQDSHAFNPFTGKPYHNFAQISRFGTGRAEIVEFCILTDAGEIVTFVYPGEMITVVIQVLAFDTIQTPLIGSVIYDRLRSPITGFNTYQLQIPMPPLHKGEGLRMSFRLKWPDIQEGNYLLEPSIADGVQENHEMLDWLQCPFHLMSGVSDLTFGLIRLTEIEGRYEQIPSEVAVYP